MTKTFGAWTHPTTGERRVYLNDHGLHAKVWLTEAPDGGWEENFRAYEGCFVDAEDVFVSVQVALEEQFGTTDVKFEALWEAGQR